MTFLPVDKKPSLFFIEDARDFLKKAEAEYGRCHSVEVAYVIQAIIENLPLATMPHDPIGGDREYSNQHTLTGKQLGVEVWVK